MLRNRTWPGLALVFIMLAVMLTACGGGDGGKGAANSPSPAASPSQTPSASPDTAAVRSYTDALGRTVDIPANPQRIVTTQYLPELLAVGVKPIGAVTHLLTSFASVKDQIAGIEDLGAINEMNLEKTLELQPDLIIATESSDIDMLDKLGKIAPTVVVKWDGRDPFQHFRDVADIVGKNDAAEAWTQAYEKKAEDARAKLASYVKPGETFGVVVIGGYEKGQLRVYGPGNVGYTLFDTLKFPMTDAVKTEWGKGNNQLGLKISLEKLPEFASADRLFLVKFDNDPDFVTQVENSSLWKDLPAVKNGKVYTVDDNIWFSYDVMSFNAQLDDAIRLLGS